MFRKKSLKSQWKFKNLKFQKQFEKIEISKFWIFIDFSMIFFENFLVSKNIFRTFFKIFFGFEKFYVIFGKNILKSKICPGIQKSYLENRASILKLFKIKNPLFSTQITGFPYSVTYTDP